MHLLRKAFAKPQFYLFLIHFYTFIISAKKERFFAAVSGVFSLHFFSLKSDLRYKCAPAAKIILSNPHPVFALHTKR